MPARAAARRDGLTAAALAVVSGVYLAKTLALPSGSASHSDVGPRAFPMLIGVALAALTVLLALSAARQWRRARAEAAPAEAAAAGHERRTYPWRLLAMVVASAVYLRLLEPLGFLIATALYLAAGMACVDGVRRHAPVRLAAVALGFGVATSIGVYVLFDAALGVLLPTGLFGWSF